MIKLTRSDTIQTSSSHKITFCAVFSIFLARYFGRHRGLVQAPRVLARERQWRVRRSLKRELERRESAAARRESWRKRVRVRVNNRRVTSMVPSKTRPDPFTNWVNSSGSYSGPSPEHRFPYPSNRVRYGPDLV